MNIKVGDKVIFSPDTSGGKAWFDRIERKVVAINDEIATLNKSYFYGGKSWKKINISYLELISPFEKFYEEFCEE